MERGTSYIIQIVSHKLYEMRLKKTDNKDGTWSLYNQTEKCFLVENGTEKEVDELKKRIDKHRKDRNQLRNGG